MKTCGSIMWPFQDDWEFSCTWAVPSHGKTGLRYIADIIKQSKGHLNEFLDEDGGNKNLNVDADVIQAWPQEPIGRRDDRPFEDERDAHTDAVCSPARRPNILVARFTMQ